MALTDYISPEQAAQPGMLPMGGGQPPDMQAFLEAMRAQQQPEPAPLAERLEAPDLFRMFQAWETAKTAENLEMYDSARYYHSKQYTDAELKTLKKRNQPPITKNLIRRKIDFLVGLEQRLRRDPKAFPRTPESEAAAPVATATLRFIQDTTKWQSVASECARDALVRGIGAQWGGVARDKKNKFQIKKRRVKGDAWFYDPRSEEWDFSDALFVGEAQWTPTEVAKELLPWAVETIDQIGEIAAGSRSMLPQLFDKERNWTQWVNGKERRIFLVSIWYRHNGQWLFDFLVGPMSLCPPEMDCLSPYVNQDDDTCHPYKAWSPYVGEDATRYGMIRDLKSLQDEVNKRASKALHLLTVRQTKSEKGAVDDIEAAKRELAKPDGHIEFNKGFAFEVIEQTAQIQGNLELMQDAKMDINNNGPNPALQGKGVESQSGRAILAQQNSGMAELSPVYERMREWKLQVYHHDWSLARKFYTDDRYIRITGQVNAPQHLRINIPTGQVDPQTGQPILENAIAEMDVDVILDEGPDTVTMREELIEQISQRPDIPSEILIEMSNLPDKDVLLQKLQEFKAPPPEIMELQKRMAQLEELKAAADVDKVVADIEKTQADTVIAGLGAGMPPEMLPQIGQVFPFVHRQPTFLDQAQQLAGGPPPGMQPNALAGPPDGMAPPGGGMPPNALDASDGAPMPPGAEEPQQDFLEQSSTPWIPGEEPRLNQAGGLPMPAGGV
jgi:hypothetical protein